MTSTIAPQALLLMNDPFVIQQARNAAKRLQREVPDRKKRIELAYLRILGRYPRATELELVSNYLGREDNADRWSSVMQTLFQSLDFRYVY